MNFTRPTLSKLLMLYNVKCMAKNVNKTKLVRKTKQNKKKTLIFATVLTSAKFAKSIKRPEFLSQPDSLVIYFIGFLMTIYHETGNLHK